MKTWKDVVNNTFYVGDQQAPWDTEVIELSDWKLARKQYITEQRYIQEIAGVKDATGTVIYDSDRVTQSRIAQTVKLVELNPNLTSIRWKLANDTWTEIAASEISAMAIAIGNHVQSCFETEFNLHSQIDQAATIDAVLAIDWPK